MSLTSFLAPAIPRAHALALPTRRITPPEPEPAAPLRLPPPRPSRAPTPRPPRGLSRTLAEFWNLFQGMRAAARQIPKDVAYQVALQRLVEGKFRRLTGRRLEGCDILEIGAGQSLRAATGFAARNDVTATDLDVYAAGLDLPAYFRLLRSNGPKRLLKTVGLRILGTDRPLQPRPPRSPGCPRLPRPRFRQMDATRLATPRRLRRSRVFLLRLRAPPRSPRRLPRGQAHPPSRRVPLHPTPPLHLRFRVPRPPHHPRRPLPDRLLAPPPPRPHRRGPERRLPQPALPEELARPLRGGVRRLRPPARARRRPEAAPRRSPRRRRARRLLRRGAAGPHIIATWRKPL